MTDFSNSVLGVTGANGYVGRAVIAQLKARGAKRVVGITRDPSKLADVEGIEVRHGDFSNPASLDVAFSGVDRLLIISTDNVGGRIDQQQAAIDAAERAGVSHLIYTSITAPYPHAQHAVSNDHFWTEARLFRFKGGWTSLRDNIYADFIVWDAAKTLESGKIFHAAGDGKRAVVFRDDIAATAAGALLTATGQEIVDVSGPEPLSYADIAATLSRLGGKPVEAIDVGHEAQLDGMLKGGLPPGLAAAFAGFDVAVKRGALAIVGNGVQRFAGREPLSVADALRKALGA
ncbi:MAG: NAD-dependent epimerase/dehydratase family protein [Hyphomicrobiales bacterium]|nr:MAG: NAD-dependent epimerase/dehydratase family protein [Hyphomicrobiales bacterium]